MLFMVTYSIRPEHRDVAQARFKATGGMPPAGVKMVGRWHNVGGLNGFVLAEGSDNIALAKWLQEWTDVLTFDVIPVANDEDTMKVLGG